MLGTWFSVVWFSPAGVEDCGPVASGRPQAEWTEREILLRFYAATGGPEGMWEDASNWGSARPLEEWYGVFVDGDGKVDSLILTGNGLDGVLPESLGRLTGLTALDLMGNRLSGTIPAALGSLANLDFLDLSRNRLTGVKQLAVQPDLCQVVAQGLDHAAYARFRSTPSRVFLHSLNDVGGH